MGARPTPIRWRRHSYASAGWLLGDYLMLFPLATDQEVAAAAGLTPQTIRYWRVRAGIPAYRERAVMAAGTAAEQR